MKARVRFFQKKAKNEAKKVKNAQKCAKIRNKFNQFCKGHSPRVHISRVKGLRYTLHGHIILRAFSF